jgi:hypothetical protein
MSERPDEIDPLQFQDPHGEVIAAGDDGFKLEDVPGATCWPGRRPVPRPSCFGCHCRWYLAPSHLDIIGRVNVTEMKGGEAEREEEQDQQAWRCGWHSA